MVGGRGLGLSAPPPPPPPPTTTIPTSVKLRSFEEPYLRYFWQQITFKLGNSINLKALFPSKLTDRPNFLSMSKVKKEKPMEGLFHIYIVRSAFQCCLWFKVLFYTADPDLDHEPAFFFAAVYPSCPCKRCSLNMRFVVLSLALLCTRTLPQLWRDSIASESNSLNLNPRRILETG